MSGPAASRSISMTSSLNDVSSWAALLTLEICCRWWCWCWCWLRCWWGWFGASFPVCGGVKPSRLHMPPIQDTRTNYNHKQPTCRRNRCSSANYFTYTYPFLPSVACLWSRLSNSRTCLECSTDLDVICQDHSWCPVSHCVRCLGSLRLQGTADMGVKPSQNVPFPTWDWTGCSTSQRFRVLPNYFDPCLLSYNRTCFHNVCRCLWLVWLALSDVTSTEVISSAAKSSLAAAIGASFSTFSFLPSFSFPFFFLCPLPFLSQELTLKSSCTTVSSSSVEYLRIF